MSSSVWSWAVSSVLEVITAIFGYAITLFGAATLSIMVLIWLYAVVRLIVRPIMGTHIYGDIASTDAKTRAVMRERAENKSKYGV